MPFAEGTRVIQSPLGFKRFPEKIIDPTEYNPPAIAVDVQFSPDSIESTHKWLPWVKKKSIVWLAVVPHSTKNAGIRLNSGDRPLAIRSRPASLYLNLSKVEGDVVGPFQSSDSLIKWVLNQDWLADEEDSKCVHHRQTTGYDIKILIFWILASLMSVVIIKSEIKNYNGTQQSQAAVELLGPSLGVKLFSERV